jgi:hypothetical protein
MSFGNNSVLLCFFTFLLAFIAFALDSSAGQPDLGEEHAEKLNVLRNKKTTNPMTLYF